MKLRQLLTSNEIVSIAEKVNIDTEFKDLTVKNLSDIALDLVVTEQGHTFIKGDFIYSARAIEILTQRAIRMNKELF